MEKAEAIEHIRKVIDVIDGTQKGFAARAGVSQGFLSDILQGHRNPSSAVLKAAGLEEVVEYRKVK